MASRGRSVRQQTLLFLWKSVGKRILCSDPSEHFPDEIMNFSALAHFEKNIKPILYILFPLRVRKIDLLSRLWWNIVLKGFLWVNFFPPFLSWAFLTFHCLWEPWVMKACGEGQVGTRRGLIHSSLNDLLIWRTGADVVKVTWTWRRRKSSAFLSSLSEAEMCCCVLPCLRCRQCRSLIPRFFCPS